MSIEAPLSGLLDEIEAVVLERHSKYGLTNISNSPGGPFNGLRVRLYDKIARLNNAVENGVVDYADDSFRDCWVDIVGYGLIGLLVLDGDWPGVDVEVPPLDFKSLIDRVAPVEKVQAWWDRAPDWREGQPWSRAGQTYKWSTLGKSDDITGLDAWPIGTTFKSSATSGAWTWTRTNSGWTTRESVARPWPNLRSLIEWFHYVDGTITEPSPLGEAA